MGIIIIVANKTEDMDIFKPNSLANQFYMRYMTLKFLSNSSYPQCTPEINQYFVMHKEGGNLWTHFNLSNFAIKWCK